MGKSLWQEKLKKKMNLINVTSSTSKDQLFSVFVFLGLTLALFSSIVQLKVYNLKITMPTKYVQREKSKQVYKEFGWPIRRWKTKRDELTETVETVHQASQKNRADHRLHLAPREADHRLNLVPREADYKLHLAPVCSNIIFMSCFLLSDIPTDIPGASLNAHT